MGAFWDGQRVYLTGGTGFIGSGIARRITDAGAEVMALTRDRARGQHLAEMGCQVVEGNVLDPGTLAIPEDTDIVIHGAAWVAYGVPRQKADLFRQTNIEGTRHVVEAAKDAGARTFCHLSSVAAIGPTPAGLYTEERVHQGRYPEYRSLYEETKHKAHVLVEEEAGSMRTVLPMPGVVLGLDGEFDALIRGYAQGKLWSLKGDNPSPFVHVEDTIDGIVTAVEKGKGSYILADQNLTLDQLMHVFQEASGIPVPKRRIPVGLAKALATVVQLPYHLMGKVPPVSRELAEQLELPFTVSAQRAVKELGWQPDLVGHLREDFERLGVETG